ncbi:MAG: restriction endonuclease subunit S [Bacteroidetes bacterium]|nr:restriction endonuclease subunit S [Bacteroidota bacterium]
MNEVVPLEKAAAYVTSKVSSSNVTVESFVTVDNLLPDRAGLTTASGLPPAGGFMPAYMEGDILVGNIRPYLKKIWFANIDGGCSNDVLVIRANPGYSPKFLYYALLRDEFFAHMMNGKKGTKMPRGDKKQIMRFPIPEFQYSEQVEIASVLSTLDAKIALNARINAELEALAKLIYDYWFVQFDFPISAAQAKRMGKPKLAGKPYKSSGGAMVHNQELKREVPEGWEVTELGNHLTIERGVSYTSADLADSGTAMINLDSFTLHGRYKPTGLKYVNRPIKETKLLEPGDLLIATTDVTRNADIISRSFILPDVFDQKPTYSTDIARINVGPKINKYVLDMLLNTDHFHRYIKGFANGTLVLHLNMSGLVWYRAELAPLDLQTRYQEIKEPIERKKALIMKENQELTALRDWLLPLLMNGQVVVGEAEEKVGMAMAAEPAGRYGKNIG